eukprot:TRINITY_DN3302_c0_g1_i1.p1 TRINITY_DN3302_c0_g1~~TRINITY_DN3302_c0_g1_i1.p1  ORF type:complete len:494 (+),score=128.39 TRINITY_DN3302_c0_g1_i1:1210-2691(+)
MDDEDDYEFEEEEVAEDDDDEDMGYYPEEAQPVSKKLEQECLTPDARRAAQAKVISDTVDLLALGEGAVRVLLRAYNWKYDRLQERYFEDAAGMRAKYGISCTSEPFKWAGDTTVECGVCYSESSETSAVAVSGCGHYFCLQCFGQYFAHQLSEKGMSSLSVTCPWNGCTFVCERKLVIAVLSRASLQAPYEGMNEALLKRYEMFHERSFVEDNPYVQWCPSPRCENCIRVSTVASDESLVVHCNCGMTFCFRCCEEDHMPATCEMLRVWLRKEQDESETANWIVANTKPCPGCGVNIEKNDGCNHITCQSCSYDFCWVCEQEWSKHGSNWYQCNFYEPTKDGEKGKRDTAKDELDRYIFYYTRYNNHDHSKHLEKKVIEQTKKRMALLQQDANADLHQVEYLQEAAEQLIRSREALKYTYVYAFNLKSGAEKSLFEFNQAQLEHSTETLSKMLEPRSKRQRQDVINQQALVRRSLERLQQVCCFFFYRLSWP